MDRIEEIIKELNKQNTHWKDTLREQGDLLKIEDKELRQAANEILSELRVLLKKDKKESVLEQIKEKMGDGGIAEIFVECALVSLETFFVMEPIRKKDTDEVLSLFAFLFKNYILRYNKSFSTNGLQFGLTGEEMENIAKNMDFLVRYYVGNHYSRWMILEDFEDETGLEGEAALLFSDLIEENYQTLQLNWIIDKLDVIEM